MRCDAHGPIVADFYHMIMSNIQSSRDQNPWCNYAKLFRCFSYRVEKKLLGKRIMCCDQMCSLTSTEGRKNDELLAAYGGRRVEVESKMIIIQNYDFEFKLEIWKKGLATEAEHKAELKPHCHWNAHLTSFERNNHWGKTSNYFENQYSTSAQQQSEWMNKLNFHFMKWYLLA